MRTANENVGAPVQSRARQVRWGVGCLFLSMLLVACGGSGSSGGDGGTTNTAPVADAGPAQGVSTGTLVTLDATATTDAEGDALTYRWSFQSRPAGSAAALSNPSTVHPTFIPDMAGEYVVKLVVFDTSLASSEAATVTITASAGNSAPVANAGPDQNVATGATVTLDGSGSSDANGDPITYHWSFTSVPSGSTASLSSATVVNPTFTADLAGTYQAQLVVNDGQVDSVASTVSIIATAALSGDNDLAGLVLLDATCTLSPAFHPATTSYTVNVASVVPNIRVQATLSSSVATMTIAGAAATSGTATPGISLAAGANDIPIVVTAENGNVRTYTVTVNKAAPVDATPATWTGSVADLFGTSGTAPTGTIDTNQPSTLTMTVTGGNVNSTNRRFFFANAQVTGDFQLTARMTGLTGTFTTVNNNAFRYGLFMTENISGPLAAWTDSARFAELGYYTATATPTLFPSRAYKLDVGTGSAQSRSTINTAPLVNTGVDLATAATVYLRLTRLGSRFVFSFSTDDVTYTSLNTSTFADANAHPLSNTWLVGFFGAPQDTLTFTYDSISIVQ